MKPQPIPPTAEEQASLWAARLDGSTLSAADQAALDAWLAADPTHRPLLSAYCQFSADLEQQLPLIAGIGEELAENPTALKTAQPSPRLLRPLLAGVALAAAAALAVLLWPQPPQDQSQNYATPVARREALVLADGTHVELNARTALAVSFSAAERHVRLAGGEAFFSVTKDPARPFIVETPAGSVRVTGTQFNVRTEAAALEVTVLDGTVQVRPGDTATVHSLHAGEQLAREQGRTDVHTLTAAALDDAVAWRRGKIVFAGTPLRDALSRYARYHGRTLSASDAAALQRVGGLYSLDDLDSFLRDLEQVLPVRVLRESDGTILVDTVPGR